MIKDVKELLVENFKTSLDRVETVFHFGEESSSTKQVYYLVDSLQIPELCGKSGYDNILFKFSLIEDVNNMYVCMKSINLNRNNELYNEFHAQKEISTGEYNDLLKLYTEKQVEMNFELLNSTLVTLKTE